MFHSPSLVLSLIRSRWQYVKENDVQLPDEYDQIYEDLEPFWGVAPADLRKTQAELEKKKDSFTLGKNKEGKIDVLAWAFTEGMYNQYIRQSEPIIALLRVIEDYLPSFRATFSPHDGPNRVSDYGIKNVVLEAAANRKGTPPILASVPRLTIVQSSDVAPCPRYRGKVGASLARPTRRHASDLLA